MTNKKSLKEQVQANFKDFTTEVDRLTTEQLKARIVLYQQNLAESESHKKENESLTKAKAEVQELSAPYNDVKKAVKIKTAYLLALIAEKGS